MRTLVGVLLHPRRTSPPPLAIDLRVVALVGALLWTLAGVVCVVLASSGTTTWRPVETCAAGVVLGLVGAEWARRQGRDDDGAVRDASGSGDEALPLPLPLPLDMDRDRDTGVDGPVHVDEPAPVVVEEPGDRRPSAEVRPG